MTRSFKSYDLNQPMLIGPDVRDWLPANHLVRFVAETVSRLDLTSIYREYDRSSRGGEPYDPKMLLSLLIYGNCMGVRSSRKIEKATYEDLGFRYLSADQHPDHDTISTFRQRYLQSINGILRGAKKVEADWQLVCLAYNLKKMHRLGAF